MREFFKQIFELGYTQYKGLGISQEGVETAEQFRNLAEQMKPLAEMQDLYVQPWPRCTERARIIMLRRNVGMALKE